MKNKLLLSLCMALIALPSFGCPSDAKQREVKHPESCADKGEKNTAKADSSAIDTRAMIAPKALEQSTAKTKRVPLSRSGGSASGTFIKVPVK